MYVLCVCVCVCVCIRDISGVTHNGRKNGPTDVHGVRVRQQEKAHGPLAENGQDQKGKCTYIYVCTLIESVCTHPYMPVPARTSTQACMHTHASPFACPGSLSICRARSLSRSRARSLSLAGSSLARSRSLSLSLSLAISPPPHTTSRSPAFFRLPLVLALSSSHCLFPPLASSLSSSGSFRARPPSKS